MRSSSKEGAKRVMNNGWIKLHRSIEEWEWWEDHNTTRLFTYCLLKANHADNKWRGIVIPRGSFVTGRTDLATKTGLTEQQIRTAISKLKSTGEITTQTTNKGTTISVCNYDTYQSQGEASNQQSNQQPNQPATREQPESNQRVTTNKNDKKKKNDKNLTNETTPDGVECVEDDGLIWASTGKRRYELAKPLVAPFLLFYEAYGFKKAKASAAHAFSNIPWTRDATRNKALVDKIVKAASLMPVEHAKSRASGITPLHPATWLNGQRWDDEVVQPVATSTTITKRIEPPDWRVARDELLADPESAPRLKEALSDMNEWDNSTSNIQNIIRNQLRKDSAA